MKEASDVEMEDNEEMEEDKADKGTTKKVYLPGVSRNLKEDEELEFDPDAYQLFHTFETTRPCLSFDVAPDGLGDDRKGFPMECYLVAGTQAGKPRENELIIMGLKNLRGMASSGSDSDSSSEDDEEEEDKDKQKNRNPIMHAVTIPHHGGVNRIRVARLGESSACAVWNDQRKVQLWNITAQLNESAAMTGEPKINKALKVSPMYSFAGHRQEGYALAWSSTTTGQLASGDNTSAIHVWHMQQGGTWVVDSRPLPGHTSSVEDIQWSPDEAPLLMSCSSDATVRLWDTRTSGKESCVCTVNAAHASDVNVLSWNGNDSSMIVTGGDDAALHVWTLKTIQYGQPVARFKQHTGPITSVEWHPVDSTTFIATGEDDQTSIWDIAMEADDAEAAGDEDKAEVEGVPPQLLFLHLGQKEVKEAHWHTQIPGLAVTTALNGFNVFKTINS